MHTNLSHDGRLSLAELRQFFSSKGYSFVCLTDHSQDLNADNWAELLSEAERLSERNFLFIPGIEVTCDSNLHIMGVGLRRLIDSADPARVITLIHDQNALAVLSHPCKEEYPFDPTWISLLDGVEIWNFAYDGRYLPQPRTINKFFALREHNKSLLAFCGLDFHQRGGYGDVGIYVEADKLERDPIIKALRNGKFYSQYRSIRFDPHPSLSRLEKAIFSAGSAALNSLRRIRSKLKG